MLLDTKLDVGMRINEPEADDGAFDSDRAAGVVDAGDE
jgi:hypothetical protein